MWSDSRQYVVMEQRKKKILHRGGKEGKGGKEVTEEGQRVMQEMKFDVDSCY